MTHFCSHNWLTKLSDMNFSFCGSFFLINEAEKNQNIHWYIFFWRLRKAFLRCAPKIMLMRTAPTDGVPSFWNNRPQCSPTYFLSKLLHNLNRRKNSPEMLATLVIKKTAQRKQSPENSPNQGPMLWFFKYFCRKIQQKNWRFCLKTKPNFEKSWS
jgi:hypothetical protein